MVVFPCICKVFDLPSFKPFILNIRKLILLSYVHKLLCWLVLKIYCDIKTNIPFVENFLRFHYLSGKYCLKIVWRFYLLITAGSERIKIWYIMTEWQGCMGKYLAWGHDIQTRGSEVLVWWVKCFPVWPNQTQLMSIYQISTKCWKFQNFCFSLKTVKTCIKEQVHLRTFRLKFVQKSTKYTRTHSAWKKIPLSSAVP